MENLHFHFHGDVHINLNLPMSNGGEPVTDRDYQKLVDSLEEYLHDAADEAFTPEHEVDSIVMVARPGQPPEVMLETESWEDVESQGCYDCLEVVSDDTLDIDRLMIVFDGRRVLHLGQERYLLGPVVIYKCDAEGDGVSLTAEDVIAAVVYFNDHTVTLCGDGKDFKAFRI